MSLCPHGYTAFYDCPTCPEPMGTAPSEIALQRRAVESGGAVTPGDVEANDVEFRCEPVESEPAVFPATVICAECDGRGCIECENTGEVVAP